MEFKTVRTLGANDEQTENPETLEIQPAPEQEKKRRGRAKSTPNVSGKKEKMSAKQICGILEFSHFAAAEALKMPELAIKSDEAMQLSEAIVEVMGHYDFEASAKSIAWANLIGVAAVIYGPRIVAGFINKKQSEF